MFIRDLGSDMPTVAIAFSHKTPDTHARVAHAHNHNLFHISHFIFRHERTMNNGPYQK